MKEKTAIKKFRNGSIQVLNDLPTNERVIEFLKKECPDWAYENTKNFKELPYLFRTKTGGWGISKYKQSLKTIPLSQIQPSKNKRIEVLEGKVNEMQENPKTTFYFEGEKIHPPLCFKRDGVSELKEKTKNISPIGSWLEISSEMYFEQDGRNAIIFNNGKELSYGFDFAGDFTEYFNLSQNLSLVIRCVSTSEITEMLKKECDKIGIVKGVKVKSLVANYEGTLTGEEAHRGYDLNLDQYWLKSEDYNILVYEKGKFATVLEHAKEEPFVLPEKWMFKVTKENIDELKSIDVPHWEYNYKYTIGGYYNLEQGSVCLLDGYTEISYSQFKEHVLNKKETEEEIDWSKAQFLKSKYNDEAVYAYYGTHEEYTCDLFGFTTGSTNQTEQNIYKGYPKVDFKPFKGKITIE